jgi:protocatechuate 3,4-dioxygenase beta subunit
MIMSSSKSRLLPIIGFLFVLGCAAAMFALFFWAPDQDSPAGPELTYKAVAKTKVQEIKVERSPTTMDFKNIPGVAGTSRSKTVSLKKFAGRAGSVKRIMKGGPSRRVMIRELQPEVKVAAEILQKTGLKGRIINSQKAPIGNVKVTIRRQDFGMGGGMMGSMVFEGMPRRAKSPQKAGISKSTDDEGRFEILGLNPHTRYSVTVEESKDLLGLNQRAPTLRPSEVINAGDFVLHRPGKLSGIVYDPNGKAVPGALVRLNDAKDTMPIMFGSDEDEEEEGEGKDRNVEVRGVIVAQSSEGGAMTIMQNSSQGERADENGRFTFDKLKPGKYTVTGSKKGLRKGQVANIAVGESQHVEKVKIQLGVAGKMTVTIKDKDGQLLAGVNVRLSQAGGFAMLMMGQKQGGVLTDNNGVAHFVNLSQKKYRVVARGEGYSDGSTTAEFPDDAEEMSVSITLKEGTKIIGRVLSEKDRTPVADATVFIHSDQPMAKPLSPGGMSVPVMVQTDNEGRFVSRPLNVGAYKVSISSHGLQQKNLSQNVGADDGKEIDMGDILLGSLVKLEVTVLDVEGNPLQGARVQVNQGTGRGLRIRREEKKSDDGEEVDVDFSMGSSSSGQMTDEKGVVVLDNVSPGDVVLRVTKPGQPDGYAENIKVVEGASPPPVTVRLTESGSIDGQVRNKDQDVSKAMTVYLYRKGHRWPVANVKSDADGRYNFTNVTPGFYVLKVASLSILSGSETNFIEVHSKETTQEDLTAPLPSGNN